MKLMKTDDEKEKLKLVFMTLVLKRKDGVFNICSFYCLGFFYTGDDFFSFHLFP